MSRESLQRAITLTPAETINHFEKWTGTKMRKLAEPMEPLKSALKEENENLLDLYEHLLERFELESVPQAYRKNKHVKSNASIHKDNKIWFRYDFKSFYDTIKLDDVMPFIKSLYPDIDFNKELYERCFIDPKTNGLIQGSPTSGTLAGIALIPFWQNLRKELPNATFTQYSDDLCISTNDETITQKDVTSAVKKAIKDSGLDVIINPKKTTVNKNQYRKLTGVACNHKNETTPFRKDYRNYRALLHAMEAGSVVKTLKSLDKSASQFLGKLTYMQFIDETGKIDRLIEKHPKAFKELRLLAQLESKGELDP